HDYERKGKLKTETAQLDASIDELLIKAQSAQMDSGQIDMFRRLCNVAKKEETETIFVKTFDLALACGLGEKESADVLKSLSDKGFIGVEPNGPLGNQITILTTARLWSDAAALSGFPVVRAEAGKVHISTAKRSKWEPPERLREFVSQAIGNDAL